MRKVHDAERVDSLTQRDSKDVNDGSLIMKALR